MNETNITVFPGQGAQFVGMGAPLFDRYEYHLQLADEVLGYSLKSLCLDDPEQQLASTQFTQPALYVVNILHYLDNIERQPDKPDVLAGHSLGEYCALFAAGAFSFETGLRIVAERGRLMNTCKNGSMAAVIGLSYTDVSDIITDSAYDQLDIANINTHKQLVVSGNLDQLTTLEQRIDGLNTQFHWLNVSGAFHSNAMRSITPSFEAFLQTCHFFPLQIPVIANVTADYYPMNDPVQLIDLLTRQLSNPVQWLKTMEFFPKEQLNITESGPKPVLSRLFEQIKSEGKAKLNTEA